MGSNRLIWKPACKRQRPCITTGSAKVSKPVPVIAKTKNRIVHGIQPMVPRRAKR